MLCIVVLAKILLANGNIINGRESKLQLLNFFSRPWQCLIRWVLGGDIKKEKSKQTSFGKMARVARPNNLRKKEKKTVTILKYVIFKENNIKNILTK